MTTTMAELDDDVLAEAAQGLFASEWADAREGAGFAFAAGTEIAEVCPVQDTGKLLGLVRPHVARLTRCWGRSVGELFSLMEIPEDDRADALYYVLMGCRGHGVGLEDDFDENIEIAESKLGIEIEPSPFSSELIEFADLAHEVVEAEALTPDEDPALDGSFRPGDRVHLDARTQGNGILSHVLNRTFSRYSSLKAPFSRLVPIPRRHPLSRFSKPRANRRITLTFAAAWPVRTRDSSSRKLTSSCQCS